MKVKVIRDWKRQEGSYGAWDGHVWDDDEYVGAVTGTTREETVTAARALAAQYQDTEPVAEWVEL